MVARKVSNLPSHLTRVTTLEPLLKVLTVKPGGVFTLSGETALVMASASLSLSYNKMILASKEYPP